MAASIAASGTRSSGVTGNDFMGLRSLANVQESDVWLEQLNDSTWLLSLGKDTAGGRVYDWRLQAAFSAGPDGSTAVELTAPAVMTSNGSLVNKDAFGEARNLLLEALTTGAPPHGSSELNASQRGLATPTYAAHQSSNAAAPVYGRIETSLEGAALERGLGLVPYSVISQDASQRTVQLTPAGDGTVATITTYRYGAVTTLDIAAPARTASDPFSNVLATERALLLPTTVLRAVGTYDPQAIRRQLVDGVWQ